ncbi:zeta toxin family protein [Acinetobacter baumannii]
MRDNFENFIKGLVNLSSAHCVEQEHPKAIITVGEEGSGKEVLALQAQDELSRRGGSVLIGENYYKGFTENYLNNVKDNDIKTAKDAEKEAKYLSDKVLDKAIENKHNVVINEKSENPYDFKDVTDKLHSNGYDVEVRAMATPHEHSLIRNNTQYEDQKGNLGFGDHKGFKDFDSKNVESILSISEEHNAADKVKVYDRVGNEVYNNELNPDKETWFKSIDAENTFQFETNKPLAKSEYQYNQVAWEQLIHMKNSLKAPKGEIDQTIAEKESSKEQFLNKEKVEDKDLSKLIIKTPDLYKGLQHGQVVDQDENHVLMQINRYTAIKYARDRLQDSNNQELEIGQQLFINHGAQGNYHVVEHQEAQQMQEQQEMAQQQNQQQDLDHEFTR